MAKHCPKCNFLNPYNAQICGECGHTLILPKTEEKPGKPKKPAHLSVAHRISWKSIGIEKLNQEARPPLVIALTLCLFAYGLILLVLSISTWGNFVYGLSFVMLPDNLFPLLLGVFLGAFTIILAFGFYLLKRWVVIWYFIWIGIHALLLPILWFGLWKPDWLTIKVGGSFSAIILMELIGIPFVLRAKSHLSEN